MDIGFHKSGQQQIIGGVKEIEMTLFPETIFWTSFTLVTAVYFGFPVALLARRSLRGERKGEGELPAVTLVVSAFNEAGVIREKLENALGLDYPKPLFEVLVISDGSDDGTDGIVQEYAERGVKLCRQNVRQGKSAGLTRFVPEANGEILVFSDANSIYSPDALRKLVRHFADPQIGFAVGYQRYVDDESATYESESLYWRYETWLKVQESRVGSVVCGDGAIYAIRSELFEPLRADDINDFYLPLRIIARGYRGVFDKEAMCTERTAEDFAGEFRRKARIVNRSLRAVCRVPEVLNPFQVGGFAFQLLFHKVLRWFVPLFLVSMLASSGLLAWSGDVVYAIVLLGQLMFYGVACLRWVPVIGDLKPVYVAYYFCLVNVAAAVGVLGCLLGRSISTWRPERSQSGPEPEMRTSA
jgi:cellulose synthase/poly-beta-1,6-N-acetylglucosamine synthase-like glycosyltransferase